MAKKEDYKYNFIWVATDAHKPPVFKEDKKKDWIIYGAKNLYPDYLVNLYNTSPKHNAIVNGVVNYIVGQGFNCVKDTKIGDRLQVEGFIRSVGEDSLIELNKKVATDFKLFGGFVLEPILNKQGTKMGLAHIDFSKVRVLKDNGGFAFTSDWTARHPKENEDYKEFSAFDSKDPKKDTLIYYTSYRPDLKDYPYPDYIASIPYIESEAEIANFTLKNIKNGFASSFIINFHNGQPTEEEQSYIEDMVKKKFTGTDNAGAFMLSFDDGKERSVDVIPINDDGHQDKFLNLIKQSTQEILTGHSITSPALVGIKEDTGLGNNADELRTASEAFQHRVITPIQNILEDLYNSVLVFNGLPPCLEIQRIEVITDTLSESVLVEISTIDELRERAGMAPLKAGEVTGTGSSTFGADLDWDAIQKGGYNDDRLTFIDSKLPQFNPFEDEEQAFNMEQQFISAIGTTILGLLTTNPLASISDLSEATGLTPEQVNKELASLKAEGKISVDDNEIKVEEEQPTEDETIIVYKYVERPDAPRLKTTSRPFCKNMLRLSANTSWTREQINALSLSQGRNVFRTRGGYYNNADTGVTTPYCRHIWQMRLVKIKK